MTDSAALFINYINDVVTSRAYSRKLEMEADAVGMELMATAGYDPRAAMDLWELMGCVEADAEAMGTKTSVEDRFALLRTHPTSGERYEALKGDLEGAMRLWRESAPKVLAKRKKEVEMEVESGSLEDGHRHGHAV